MNEAARKDEIANWLDAHDMLEEAERVRASSCRCHQCLTSYEEERTPSGEGWQQRIAEWRKKAAEHRAAVERVSGRGIYHERLKSAHHFSAATLEMCANDLEANAVDALPPERMNYERVSEHCYQAAKAGIWCVDYVLGGSPERSIAYDEHLVARARRAWHHGRLALEALTDALPPAPEVKDDVPVEEIESAAGLCQSEARRWETAAPKTAEHWNRVATILRSHALVAFVRKDAIPPGPEGATAQVER